MKPKSVKQRVDWAMALSLGFVAISVICPSIIFWMFEPNTNLTQGRMFLTFTAQLTGWITPLAVTALTVNWGEGKKGRALDRRVRGILRIFTTVAFVPFGMLVSLVCLFTLGIDAAIGVSENLMHTAIVVATILTGVVISLITSLLFQIAYLELKE